MRDPRLSCAWGNNPHPTQSSLGVPPQKRPVGSGGGPGIVRSLVMWFVRSQ